MTASTLQAPVGSRVTVSLRLHPVESLDDLSVRFDAPSCATLTGGDVRRNGVHLQAGTSATFAVDVHVRDAAACRIGATVLRTDDAQSRMGWVYAVVLNPKPEATGRHIQGRDAQGRPTVEAVVQSPR